MAARSAARYSFSCSGPSSPMGLCERSVVSSFDRNQLPVMVVRYAMCLNTRGPSPSSPKEPWNRLVLSLFGCQRAPFEGDITSAVPAAAVCYSPAGTLAFSIRPSVGRACLVATSRTTSVLASR